MTESEGYKAMLDDMRAENARLREALAKIEKKAKLNKVDPDLIWGIAKEALK